MFDNSIFQPKPEEISEESIKSHGYDCFQIFCSLTGQPIGQLLPSVIDQIVADEFADGSDDLETLVDSMAIRALTQMRPAPELFNLTPKRFLNLPQQTQLAYLLGRLVNTHWATKFPAGIDYLELRVQQIKVWHWLKDCKLDLSPLHSTLLHLDATVNLQRITYPVEFLPKLMACKELSALQEFLTPFLKSWRLTANKSNASGNPQTTSAFLKSFLTENPSGKPIIAHNKTRETLSQREHDIIKWKKIIANPKTSNSRYMHAKIMLSQLTEGQTMIVTKAPPTDLEAQRQRVNENLAGRPQEPKIKRKAPTLRLFQKKDSTDATS